MCIKRKYIATVRNAIIFSDKNSHSLKEEDFIIKVNLKFSVNV
jgi:hypothetical protein